MTIQLDQCTLTWTLRYSSARHSRSGGNLSTIGSLICPWLGDLNSLSWTLFYSFHLCLCMISFFNWRKLLNTLLLVVRTRDHVLQTQIKGRAANSGRLSLHSLLFTILTINPMVPTPKYYLDPTTVQCITAWRSSTPNILYSEVSPASMRHFGFSYPIPT